MSNSAVREVVAFLLRYRRDLSAANDFSEWQALARSRAEEIRQRSGLTFNDLLDAVALRVAREYAAGRMSFTEGDLVANGLWQLFLFREPPPESIPDVMWNVYLAFDAGEFLDPGEPPGTDPEEKYTRPQIEAVVAQADAK